MTNAQLIEQFYNSFAQRDAAGMLACYAPDVEFADAVFTVSGKRAFAMWAMLVEAGKDIVVTHRGVEADAARGKAHWEATYTFSATGRHVHNILDAEFRFRDGKIVWHHDRFDFWRWARQALGPTGLLLGWTPFVQNSVRARASANFDKFIAAHPQYR
jgi:ketosteroid isomerase-like protein